MKVKYIKKAIKQALKPYLGLPHLWTLLIIAALAFIMLWLSIDCKDVDSYLSSTFSSIFVGLLTGVTICLISTIKSVSLYRTECLITWLDDLHNYCLKFIDMYRGVLSYTECTLRDDDELYDYIYDVLCCGNDICSIIRREQFDKVLPFNTCKYCKKEFSFDAIEISKGNDKLREDIMALDPSQLSQQDLWVLFQEMNGQILDLNGHIISKLKELNAKKKAIHISIG